LIDEKIKQEFNNDKVYLTYPRILKTPDYKARTKQKQTQYNFG